MANDFSGDANLVARYKCDSVSPLDDSVGGNDATTVFVTLDSSDYKEGSGSVDFEKDSNAYAYVQDGNLDADFPGKGGTGNTTISVCAWAKIESIPADASPDLKYRNICGKWKESSNERSWHFAFRADSGTASYIMARIGWNGGASGENLAHAIVWSIGRWYHVAWTYDGSTKAWRVRVWDDTAQAVTETTGTATNTMSPDTADFDIGRLLETNNCEMDGKIDELLIFKDVLTSTEIDSIRKGIYPSLGVGPKIHHYQMAGGL
jgi:hypothetical protein